MPEKENIGVLSIIVPCYNERNRLHLLKQGLVEFDNKWTSPYEVIIVDDGSTDGSGDVLPEAFADLLSPNGNIIVEALAQNQGKGGALAKGVDVASGDFLLTMDADIATHPLQLKDWLKVLPQHTFRKDTVYIGNRKLESSDIKTKSLRRILGNIYNLLIRLITPIKEKDTQCGFKLYPREIGKLGFKSLKEKGWAHDIEVLIKAHYMGAQIVSMPVVWVHQEDEKISVFRDGIRMAINTVRIRFKLLGDRQLMKELKTFTVSKNR